MYLFNILAVNNEGIIYCSEHAFNTTNMLDNISSLKETIGEEFIILRYELIKHLL